MSITILNNKYNVSINTDNAQQAIFKLPTNTSAEFYYAANIANLYKGCSKLAFNLQKDPFNHLFVTNMAYAYYGCRNLVGFPVCGQNVTNMASTYTGCYNLTGSPVCGNKVTNM